MNEKNIELSYIIESILLKGRPPSLLNSFIRANWIKLIKNTKMNIDNLPTDEEMEKALIVCYDRWKEDADSIDLEYAQTYRKLTHMYEKSYSMCDFKTCERIIKSIFEHTAYKPKKKEV